MSKTMTTHPTELDALQEQIDRLRQELVNHPCYADLRDPLRRDTDPQSAVPSSIHGCNWVIDKTGFALETLDRINVRRIKRLAGYRKAYSGVGQPAELPAPHDGMSHAELTSAFAALEQYRHSRPLSLEQRVIALGINTTSPEDHRTKTAAKKAAQLRHKQHNSRRASNKGSNGGKSRR